MSLVWQSLESSSAPIVGEGHCPSRNVTHHTEARWFRGITGGSMPRPYNGAVEMLWFLPCTDFLPYSICRRSSSVSPKGVSLPQLRCRSAAPGSSSVPIVGEGHCPSRDVTSYTEVRWFRGITGGSVTRPYNGAVEMLRFSLCTNFLLYPTCRRSSSVSPSGCHLLPGRRYAPEGYFSPPASLPLSSPPVRGGQGCSSCHTSPQAGSQ